VLAFNCAGADQPFSVLCQQPVTGGDIIVPLLQLFVRRLGSIHSKGNLPDSQTRLRKTAKALILRERCFYYPQELATNV
jgi:hypothetical protein